MATKTIDQYDLSSQLNDNDLFLIAKYNSSSNSYTAYNKVKYSTIKAAMTEIAQANAGSGSGGSKKRCAASRTFTSLLRNRERGEVLNLAGSGCRKTHRD